MSDEQRSMVHFQAKPEGLAARQRGFEPIEDTPYTLQLSQHLSHLVYVFFPPPPR
ncbi:MAG: hypothetical protein HQL50_10695 [Magnetococcales bacterium]|nr:hypothetical protein [Magnetococcales bacterium]